MYFFEYTGKYEILSFQICNEQVQGADRLQHFQHVHALDELFH